MNVNAMQFGLVPGRRATVVLFVVKMQNEYRDKKKKVVHVLL